jgi:hypothetical protein
MRAGEDVRTYFVAHDGRIENMRYRNIYRLSTPRLLITYPDVRANYEQVAFQKDDARRFRPDEVEFVAFGHPLLGAIVTECRKRDEGFGGAATVRLMPEQVGAEDGILFNFVLRYTDAGGDTLSEDFLPISVTGHGKVDTRVGGALFAHPLPADAAIDPDSESVARLRQALDGLYTIALEHAQAVSQAHGETVSEKRERDVQIQIEDLKRWHQARSQVHQKRLQDYRHRLALGEDMNVLIRREEGLFSGLQERYDSRKIELENQRTIVSQAPELLNLALVLNSKAHN